MLSEPLPPIDGAQPAKAPAAEEAEPQSHSHEMKRAGSHRYSTPTLRDTVNKVKMAFRLVKQRHRRAAHFVFADQTTGALPWRIRLSWVAPAMSTLPVNVVLSVWGIPHYEKMGATLGKMSLFIALARSLDVMSDPLMSYVSDSTRSKMGRRRPYMLSGCWFYALFLVLLLTPPEGTSDEVNAWFGAFYVMFYLTNTYCNIPLDALGPELTDDYDARNKLYFLAGVTDAVGTLLGCLLPVAVTMVLASGTTCRPEGLGYGYQPAGNGRWCYQASGLGAEACAVDLNTGVRDKWTIAAPAGSDALAVGGLAAGGMRPPGNYTKEVCDAAAHQMSSASSDITAATCALGFECFCRCVDDCEEHCTLGHQREALFRVGMFFAAWYVIAMVNAVFQLRERSQIADAGDPKKRVLPPPSPIVPTLLTTFLNRPFRILIPAWICDAVSQGIIASMLPFFVRYIVQPEYQPECNEGRPPPDASAFTKYTCDSSTVGALAVVLVLIFALVFQPMWLWVLKRVGKRWAWIMWSASMAVTNALFFFVGKGQVKFLFVISAINGMPFGAKFLADTILADMIDYDEFLRGSRSEATYTMFRSFLPKMAIILASAVPIAFMETAGHVAMKGTLPSVQPASVRSYLYVVVVGVPCVLMGVATYIKYTMPLATKEQTDQIAVGVAQHMDGHAALCPITGKPFELVLFDAEQQPLVDMLNYWYGGYGQRFLEQLDGKLTDEKKDGACAQRFIRCARRELAMSGTVLLAFLVAIGGCSNLLEDKVLVFVPVLCMVFAAFSFATTIFCFLRLKAAKQVVDMFFVHRTIDSALLASVLAQRRSMPTIPPGAHKRAYLDKIAQQLRKEHKQEHEVPAAEALGESTFGLSQRSTAKVVPEPVDGASQ